MNVHLFNHLQKKKKQKQKKKLLRIKKFVQNTCKHLRSLNKIIAKLRTPLDNGSKKCTYKNIKQCFWVTLRP